MKWAIVRHCLQHKSPLRAGQPTLRNVRTLTQNVNRVSADRSESDSDEHDSDVIDSGREDDSDQNQHLGNCAPAPPLTQHVIIS